MQHDVAKLFFGQVAQAQQARVMSPEHFSVDGTLTDVRDALGCDLFTIRAVDAYSDRYSCADKRR